MIENGNLLNSPFVPRPHRYKKTLLMSEELSDQSMDEKSDISCRVSRLRDENYQIKYKFFGRGPSPSAQESPTSKNGMKGSRLRTSIDANFEGSTNSKWRLEDPSKERSSSPLSRHSRLIKIEVHRGDVMDVSMPLEIVSSEVASKKIGWMVSKEMSNSSVLSLNSSSYR